MRRQGLGFLQVISERNKIQQCWNGGEAGNEGAGGNDGKEGASPILPIRPLLPLLPRLLPVPTWARIRGLIGRCGLLLNCCGATIKSDRSDRWGQRPRARAATCDQYAYGHRSRTIERSGGTWATGKNNQERTRVARITMMPTMSTQEARGEHFGATNNDQYRGPCYGERSLTDRAPCSCLELFHIRLRSASTYRGETFRCSTAFRSK